MNLITKDILFDLKKIVSELEVAQEGEIEELIQDVKYHITYLEESLSES